MFKKDLPHVHLSKISSMFPASSLATAIIA